jgi:predicted AAA+ superfamily ATPase
LSKSPKLHFLDPGILRAIKGNVEGLLNGHEFESAIASELYKQAKNVGFAGDFYHLRTFDGKEIDFLIETPKGYYAIEIKQSQHISSTDARHLRGLTEILDKPLLHSFILSNDNKVHQFEDNITALHTAMFLG